MTKLDRQRNDVSFGVLWLWHFYVCRDDIYIFTRPESTSLNLFIIVFKLREDSHVFYVQSTFFNSFSLLTIPYSFFKILIGYSIYFYYIFKPFYSFLTLLYRNHILQTSNGQHCVFVSSSSNFVGLVIVIFERLARIFANFPRCLSIAKCCSNFFRSPPLKPPIRQDADLRTKTVAVHGDHLGVGHSAIGKNLWVAEIDETYGNLYGVVIRMGR